MLDIPAASLLIAQKGERKRRRSNDMCELPRLLLLLLLLLLLFASYTWYEVRRCVFDCCLGRGNVDVLRFAAVHRPHTHTL